MRTLPIASWALALSIGCSGEDIEQEAAQPPAEAAPAAETTVAAPAGDIDAALADRGASVFQSKACPGCHAVGDGAAIGPDLKGITERRTFEWFTAMVTNPDSMLQADSIARELFAEYMIPMLSLDVTVDEAGAMFEYLRRESQY